MKVLMVSTEAEPFAKSGGLGDVIGSLPMELRKQGIDVRVILPLYQKIKENPSEGMVFQGAMDIQLSWRSQYCGIFTLEHQGIPFYFLDNEQYFRRDAYYGYEDDGERFAFFAKAVCDVLPSLDFQPDILHCNEWQTALVPVFLRTQKQYQEPFYAAMKTVFTIHNIEYQGKFDGSRLGELLGIDEAYRGILDHDGGLNYMKGAIVTCDRLTTVSETYSQELLYPFYGKGLEGIIGQEQGKLSGILNGIDLQVYNPAKDKSLAQTYSARTIRKKQENKRWLQQQLGLREEADVPLLAMVGRLVAHKGFDLMTAVFDELMQESVQFILLGTGDGIYEDYFREKASVYGDRISVNIQFSALLANQIYAGADLFLMPSLSEPCGLAQMISLRYGTIPVVRETGGLADSVQPYDLAAQKGNGITFSSVNAQDMLGAIKRGLALYQDQEQWSRILQNAMKTDFSWKKSAKQYIKLYKELDKEKGSR